MFTLETITRQEHKDLVTHGCTKDGISVYNLYPVYIILWLTGTLSRRHAGSYITWVVPIKTVYNLACVLLASQLLRHCSYLKEQETSCLLTISNIIMWVRIYISYYYATILLFHHYINTINSWYIILCGRVLPAIGSLSRSSETWLLSFLLHC
jgi:hypothetical protein